MCFFGVSWRGVRKPHLAPQVKPLTTSAYIAMLDTAHALGVADQPGDGPYRCMQGGVPCRAIKETQPRRKDSPGAFRGKGLWPASSPNLNVADYFVRGRLQKCVGAKERETPLAPKTAVRDASRDLPVYMSRRAAGGRRRRVAPSAEQHGV